MERLTEIPRKGELVVYLSGWESFVKHYQVVGWSPTKHSVVVDWLRDDGTRKRTFLYVRDVNNNPTFQPTGYNLGYLYRAYPQLNAS